MIDKNCEGPEREYVEQDKYVNVKLETFVHEFVNSDFCVNVKHAMRLLRSII